MSLSEQAAWLYYRELYLCGVSGVPNPSDTAITSRGILHLFWEQGSVLMIINDAQNWVELCSRRYELNQEVFIKLRELLSSKR